jgi:hypothetical protein
LRVLVDNEYADAIPVAKISSLVSNAAAGAPVVSGGDVTYVGVLSALACHGKRVLVTIHAARGSFGACNMAQGFASLLERVWTIDRQHGGLPKALGHVDMSCGIGKLAPPENHILRLEKKFGAVSSSGPCPYSGK